MVQLKPNRLALVINHELQRSGAFRYIAPQPLTRWQRFKRESSTMKLYL